MGAEGDSTALVVRRWSRMTTPAKIIRLNDTDNSAVKTRLLALSRSMEARIGITAPNALVVATIQSTRFLTGRTRSAFERIAAAGANTYLAGAGRPAEPLRGVTWVQIPYGHPLRQEWNVFIIGEEDSAALVSRELPPSLDEQRPVDGMRRFRWRLTEDRALALRCANAVINVRREGLPAQASAGVDIPRATA